MQTPLRANSLTICIPARNEASTVESVVQSLWHASAHAKYQLEEILVIDDRSTDDTASKALRAGARVVSTVSHCQAFGGSLGKGDALWVALRECRTDLVGFVDADLQAVCADRVMQMFIPLVSAPNVQLVKGHFLRTQPNGEVSPGRVTTLMARPLLELLFPALSHMREPISGIFAGRTEVLGSLWLDCDYGVDVGVLLDIAMHYGVGTIVEHELGVLTHRRRPLNELGSMSKQVARAILSRSNGDDASDVVLTSRRVPPRSMRMARATPPQQRTPRW